MEIAAPIVQKNIRRIRSYPRPIEQPVMSTVSIQLETFSGRTEILEGQKIDVNQVERGHPFR
jgi:hypothetical protein